MIATVLSNSIKQIAFNVFVTDKSIEKKVLTWQEGVVVLAEPVAVSPTEISDLQESAAVSVFLSKLPHGFPV